MHLWGLALFGAVAAATWWAPPWPAEQALHSSLTVVALGGLWWVHRRIGLPARVWTWALVFLTLHTIAARWLYSSVPYDDWTGGLFGFRLSEVFGWERNHFDRLVHFAYGLCLAMALRLRPVRALEVVLATSALYELFEWGIAELLAPGTAEAYNGQQGDMWDAHKDMALAALGALVAVVVHTVRRTPRHDAILGAGQLSGRRPVRGGNLR
ncbi:DUF2238 domain-containing protein [Actinophytocola glycyrrhizae]|uniref:DUF2238 domain-containing protein n=1 Tax=Actinophytocola glycyrrhizae TaxID=2044873 RepID=A0ABV9SC32_9PSEU